jgi:hypothetical protein
LTPRVALGRCSCSLPWRPGLPRGGPLQAPSWLRCAAHSGRAAPIYRRSAQRALRPCGPTDAGGSVRLPPSHLYPPTGASVTTPSPSSSSRPTRCTALSYCRSCRRASCSDSKTAYCLPHGSHLCACHLLVTHYLLPAAYCLLPTAYCLLPTAYLHYLLPAAYCLLPTAYCLPPTAYCLLPTAYCLLHTAYCLLPTAYCLLPTAYCLLPTSAYTAYCLLPTSALYCLLPTAYRAVAALEDQGRGQRAGTHADQA